jgi:hypothetical protein
MVITHSHPFDHSENEKQANHNHSKTEICFYASVNFDYYDSEPVLQLLFFKREIICQTLVFNQKSTFQKSVFQFGPRGPPVLQIR